MVTGLGLLVLWIVLLSKNLVPDLKTETVKTTAHIFSEFLTALVLLVAAFGLLKNKNWGAKTFLVGDGMLLYSVINAAGYYSGQGNKYMLYVFLMVLVILFQGSLQIHLRRMENLQILLW